MLRNFISVITGLATGFSVIYLVEILSHKVYPLPANINMNDPAELKNFIESLPVGALWFVLAAWALGSFSGGLVASLIAPDKRLKQAMIVAAVLMFMGIINLVMIPHPGWFVIAGILVYIPFAWLGYKLAIVLKKNKS